MFLDPVVLGQCVLVAREPVALSQFLVKFVFKQHNWLFQQLLQRLSDLAAHLGPLGNLLDLVFHSCRHFLLLQVDF